MSATPGERWAFTLSTLLGEELPALPAVPGRVIVARDEPIPAECLVGVTSPVELALVLGISRQAAHQRLQRQSETEHTEASHDQA